MPLHIFRRTVYLVGETVGIYRRKYSVGIYRWNYRRNKSVGIYRQIWRRNFFRRYKLSTEKFRREFIPTNIISSQNLSVYTARMIPSVMPSVYTDGIFPSVYTVGLPTEYTVRLEIRNGMVTSGDFTDGNYRGIQTVIAVQ